MRLLPEVFHDVPVWVPYVLMNEGQEHEFYIGYWQGADGLKVPCVFVQSDIDRNDTEEKRWSLHTNLQANGLASYFYLRERQKDKS